MRAAGRRCTYLALVGALAALLLLSGRGGGDDGGGGGDAAAGERASDVEMMNVALSQELTLIQVYNHSLRLLRGEAAEIARQFLAQEQEHVDGITRVLRGLQGSAEGEAEDVDYSRVKTAEDALLQLYEINSLQLHHYIDDVAHLNTVAPRSFVATMAANEGQHLVVFRQLLGAALDEAVPEAFDGGEVPPPVEKSALNRG